MTAQLQERPADRVVCVREASARPASHRRPADRPAPTRTAPQPTASQRTVSTGPTPRRPGGVRPTPASGEPVAPGRRASRGGGPVASVASVAVRACEVGRGSTGAPVAGAGRVSAAAAGSARVPVGGGRLYWTQRGVAVMVSLVLLIAGLMLATVTGAYLAVSDAPLDAAPAGAASSVGAAGGAALAATASSG